MPERITLFFDIGDTLASPVITTAGALQGLEVYPFVTDILKRLRADGVPPSPALGIISNTGSETLESMTSLLREAELLGYFDPNLLVFSSVEKVDKKTKEIFERAVKRANVDANRCVYISESDAERKIAESVGMQVSFHALHVFHVVAQMSR
jgi:FMN phosphatase YigB (HAD superfamily)